LTQAPKALSRAHFQRFSPKEQPRMTLHSPEQTRSMANAIRALSMDAVQKANSGHPGLPMGAADVATVLFTQFLKFDAADPHWPDRDRFILSAGHGSMLMYSLLHLLGYSRHDAGRDQELPPARLQDGGPPRIRPRHRHRDDHGALGQGIANAVGFAIAERHLNAEFGDGLVNHKTYALAGDGCLMEGISQEAITLAGHLKLKNLIVLWDDNGISIDGKLSMTDSTDQLARFAACQLERLALRWPQPG
jgi:transketolase